MERGKSAAWIRRHFCLAVYAALMLGSGVWQLLDWHYGSEDPIWHLFFYLLFMPAFSLGYGFLSEDGWLAPFAAAFLAAFAYIFMANGGFSIEHFSMPYVESALELCVPSFVAALAGAIVRKVVMAFG